MADTREQRQQMARRKKLQEITSASTAALGLTALATKGGSAGIRQVVARSPKAAKYALLPKIADKADKATVPLLTTSAGIGGIGGFNFASIQREEARREQEQAMRAKKVIAKRDRKKKEPSLAGLGAVGGGALGLVAVESGAANAFSRTVSRRAQGTPERPARPPRYEFKGGTPEQNNRVNNIKAKADRTDNPHEKATYSTKAEELRDKYGIKQKMVDPGHPGRPAIPGSARWKFADKVVNSSKLVPITAFVGGGAATGAALGYGAKKMTQRKKVAKSAFGVVEKVYDPEKARHQRTKNYQTAAGAGAVATGAAAAAAGAGKGAKQAQGAAMSGSLRSAYARKPHLAGGLYRLSEAAGRVDSVASKVPHKGRAAAALAGTSVALAATHNRIKAHRKGAGRSYSDWWDG